MDTQRIKLWDFPTRLFHWLLVALVIAAIVTGKTGGAAIEWHGRIGLGILGLLAFRIAWGFLGSTYARFAVFLPGPASLSAYFRGQWNGVGHNPLGALSVLGLLAVLGLQLATGLLGNDDIAFRGPLFDLISKGLSDQLSAYHRTLINVLIVLIALHLGAILFYALRKKNNLVKPMLNGWKDVPAGQGKSATGGGAKAFLLAVLIALLVAYGGSGIWLPPPAPAPAAAPAAAW